MREITIFDLIFNQKLVMEVVKSNKIDCLVKFIPKKFHDERGFFYESFNATISKELEGITFVQSNESFSKKGVLRGLHAQKAPYAQGKLVSVIQGKILDVAVDLRKGSPTFGEHETFVLDGEENHLLYIPEGFAHGFITTEDTIFSYRCTNYYHKESEYGIIWNDPELAIDWGNTDPIVSEKDWKLPRFTEL